LIIKCQNCKKKKKLQANGLCEPCYVYLWRTGEQRPKARYQEGFCKNCKTNVVRAGGQCSSCYEYNRRTGKKRPSRLWRTNCKNCDRPIEGTRSRRGFCNACYQYRNSNGKERPSRLFQSSVWCECGSPGTRTIETNLGSLCVCNECFELEY
jgi:hypothetical protein